MFNPWLLHILDCNVFFFVSYWSLNKNLTSCVKRILLTPDVKPQDMVRCKCRIKMFLQLCSIMRCRVLAINQKTNNLTRDVSLFLKHMIATKNFIDKTINAIEQNVLIFNLQTIMLVVSLVQSSQLKVSSK